MKKAKNKVKQYVDKNPIEQLLGGGLDQILGTSSPKEKQRGNQGKLMIEGKEEYLNLLQEKKSEEKEEKRRIEPGINYLREISHVAERAANRDNQELEMQLREIMAEIKKLVDNSKELQMQFREVAIEQRVAAPRRYHKSFFSWLLSIIRTARMKVEDSGAWLAAMHSKKKSREYGAMAKKHGTSFSLSNERNVATQVG